MWKKNREHHATMGNEEENIYATIDDVKPGDFVCIVPRTWWSTLRGEYRTELGTIVSKPEDPRNGVRVYSPSKGSWTVFLHQWYFRKLNI